MNGLHYIICSWENTFDAPSNRCVCLETIAWAPTAFVFTLRRFVSFEEPDSPIQSFQVPSVLTTSLADCNSSNYSAFFQPLPFLNQKVVRSPLTQTWPEFGRRAGNETKPGPVERVLSLRIKHCKGSSNQNQFSAVLMKHTDVCCMQFLSSQTLWCVWKDALHSGCSQQTHLPDPNPTIHNTNPPLNPKY